MTGGRPAREQRKGLVSSTPLAGIVARSGPRNRAQCSLCRRTLRSAEDSQRRCRCHHGLCRQTWQFPPHASPRFRSTWCEKFSRSTFPRIKTPKALYYEIVSLAQNFGFNFVGRNVSFILYFRVLCGHVVVKVRHPAG